MINEKNFLKVAKDAAKLGGKVLISNFGKTLKVEEKKRAEIVTFVDRKSEETIKKYILSKYKNHSFLGEESGETGNADFEYRWIVDPLDGTTNYVRGFQNFCVSIALEHKSKGVIVGVILNPTTGDIYHAIKGKGAFLNNKKITTSKTSHLNKSVLTTGFAYAKGGALKEQMKWFENFSQEALAVRRPGAAALDLCFVASGVFDGFWERGLSPWDIAAGTLILKEAGGIISDYAGNKKLNLFRREILATNKYIHKKMLAILAK